MEINKKLWMILEKQCSKKGSHYTLILKFAHKREIIASTLEVWEHGYIPSLSILNTEILIRIDYFIHVMYKRVANISMKAGLEEQLDV